MLVIGGSIGAFALSRAALPSEPPAASSPVDSAELQAFVLEQGWYDPIRRFEESITG